MVKRRISLILAIVMAVGMLLSFAGCPIKVLTVPKFAWGTYTDYISPEKEVEIVLEKKEVIIDGVSYKPKCIWYEGATVLGGTGTHKYKRFGARLINEETGANYGIYCHYIDWLNSFEGKDIWLYVKDCFCEEISDCDHEYVFYGGFNIKE